MRRSAVVVIAIGWLIAAVVAFSDFTTCVDQCGSNASCLAVCRTTGPSSLRIAAGIVVAAAAAGIGAYLWRRGPRPRPWES